MLTIKKLPIQIISKTAAGEIIDHPSSVIKELVENSIDARATEITVKLKDSGIKEIYVLDNGIGMSKEDILECYKPHTTSKVYSETDLENIQTFGFRGEALWSVSTVAELIIKSKQEQDPLGYEVRIKKDEIIKQSAVPMNTGTLIRVLNLFDTIPARKSLLKTASLELKACVDALNKLAIPNHNVQFSLYNNEKKILEYTPVHDTSERLGQVLGTQIFALLMPFKIEDSLVNVCGYLGKPQLATSLNDKQLLFVNNRFVRHGSFAKLIKEKLGSLIDPRNYPAYTIFISMEPNLIDLHVHPKKEEVRFLNEKTLLSVISNQIDKVLSENDLTYNSSYETDFFGGELNGKMSPYIASLLRDVDTGWQPFSTDLNKDILQIKNLYLITEVRDGVMFIDQHAAHEKILYEEFLNNFNNLDKTETFTLEEPIKIAFTEDSQVLENLKKLGFGFNGKNLVQIPKFFKDLNIYRILTELTHEIENSGNLNLVIEKNVNETLSFLACRTAIKSGQQLSIEERKNLIEKLQQTKTNYTCPHGRPVSFKINYRDIEKLFKRSK